MTNAKHCFYDQRKIDSNIEQTLKARYPHYKWFAIGGFVEGEATKNRRKFWIKVSPVDSVYAAVMGIGNWRLAQAEGTTQLESIDRVVLRMRQLLKDVEELHEPDRSSP
jgi:hypothetical protein